jgi:hypothetical protein
MDFVENSLRDSLSQLGVSSGCIDHLVRLDLADTAAIEMFRLLHREELDRAYWGKFQSENVPALYDKYVVPYIPDSGVWMDVGCARGTLLERKQGPKRIGLDVTAHATWAGREDITFKIISQDTYPWQVFTNNPSCVSFTWVLHHTGIREQERYFSPRLYAPGTRIVILEDAYSTTLDPEAGEEWHAQFMTQFDKRTIIRTLDFIGNRVLGGSSMPVPGTYRTLEAWAGLATQHGFAVHAMRYLGFPQGRDVHTPQSLLVLEKQ